MKNKKYLGALLLIITAMVWGAAFVAQKAGGAVGAFTFNATRSILGGAVLLPLVIAKNKGESKKQKKKVWLGGIICGAILAIASMFQQIGLETESAGKGGFITALYIIIVPILSIVFGKRPNILVFLSVILAAVGMYLLCFKAGEVTSIKAFFSFNRGERLLLVGSLLFSIHIMVIDHFSPSVNGVKMACIQFFTAGLICSVGMFVFEHPEINNILSYWKPILYAGLLSCGVGYTLQIVGQKYVQPVVASLLMSLESVFAVTFAWLLPPHATMNEREIVGCVIIFIAIVISQLQLPSRSRSK